MSILDEIKNRTSQTSVPPRQDILAGTEQPITTIEPTTIASQTPESKLAAMMEQLASYPAIANQQPIRLEADLKSRLENFCRSNKITIETLLEALFEHGQTHGFLDAVVPLAQERLQRRKAIGNLKTKITQMGNFLKG
jgi:hypothetical protein